MNGCLAVRLLLPCLPHLGYNSSMFTVSTTNPKLGKFAKHYEAALNRYFEEHPEMFEEVEHLTAERIAAYWRELGLDGPIRC